MFINTLIVSIALTAIMGVPMLLKFWLDPDDKAKNSDAGKTDPAGGQNFGCAGCGVKNIAHCSLEK